MTSLKNVNFALSQVLEFLTPWLPLANCANIDFITENFWNKFLSQDLQDGLLSLSEEQLKLLPSLKKVDFGKYFYINLKAKF